MPIENIEGAANRGPSKAAMDRAFEIKSEKNDLVERYIKVKDEMSAVVERQNQGRILMDKITNPLLKEKMREESFKIEGELGQQLVNLREEMRDLERSMEAKGIKPEEYRVQ